MTIYNQRYKFFQYLAILIVLTLLSGCGGTPKYKYNNSSTSRQLMLKTAKNMLGVKYRYGGTTPARGFDCSGLVQYSYKTAGINLPRTTKQQFNAVKRISRKYLRAGDLIFFKTTPARLVSHVGIYLGNNQFIHAPSSGKRVKINSMKERYWRKRFSAAGRIL